MEAVKYENYTVLVQNLTRICISIDIDFCYSSKFTKLRWIYVTFHPSIVTVCWSNRNLFLRYRCIATVKTTTSTTCTENVMRKVNEFITIKSQLVEFHFLFPTSTSIESIIPTFCQVWSDANAHRTIGSLILNFQCCLQILLKASKYPSHKIHVA